MAYQELSGNIFSSKCQVLVNTVNCVGDMGKGIALEFKRRFPEMEMEYKKFCTSKELRPGGILPYRKNTPWIFNFAVKDHWRYPSKVTWVEDCLSKFRDNYKHWNVESIALPWMGTANGGLSKDRVQELTREYLEDLNDLIVEVYSFDGDAEDPLYEPLMRSLRNLSVEDFAKKSGLQKSKVSGIFDFYNSGQLTSFFSLVSSGVLGSTSLDKLYLFLNKSKDSESFQAKLDLK
tara:strand:- start:649 stop:1350 length:702 start_codon:yes stop_codon:yes gene_type:complete